MRIATKEQIRKIEALAVQNGLSQERLMENAGTAAARQIRQIAGQPCQTVILCGNGNNGGDGFVIARKLLENMYPVTVILTNGQPRTAVAAEAFSKMPDLPILSLEDEPYRAASVVSSSQIVVDAVYGIGFKGELPQQIASLLEQAPESALRIAIDLPSGLDCDSGDRDAHTFKATHTVTFIAAKPALLQEKNTAVCGEISVLDIGIATADVQSVLENNVLKYEQIAACFKKREADSHKGVFGHVLAVCGSVGMAGAAILSAKAVLRSGAGLLTVALPRSIYPIVSAAVPEAVFLPLPETEQGTLSEQALRPLLRALHGKSAVLIGCGMGVSEATTLLTYELLNSVQVSTVLDADGLNVMVPHIDMLKTVKAPLILTPHPGEMSRLVGKAIEQVQAARVHTATAFSAEHAVITVLKGYRTVIADGDAYCINPTGNPGMATGGSGDVLAGMIASFIAQGMSPDDAAKCGVYLHGAAGDRAAKRCSQHAMLPSDILEELKGLFLDLE